jgi:hypothetical protein
MTDATDTAAHPAVEAPSGTPAETQADTLDNNQGSFASAAGDAGGGDADGEHTDDQGHGQSDEVEDEIEHDGKRYRVPSALKSAFMMHGDYTRKTQELAAARRSLDAERETFSRSALGHVADFGRLTALDQDIAKYANVDWQKLATDDPFAAQQHYMAYQQLKDQRNELAGKIIQAERARSHEAERTFANRYAEANAVLHRDLKGWAEAAPKVAEFAHRSGVSQEELAHIATSPALSKLLHQAWLGERVIARQKAAAAETKGPEPLKQVAKGRATPAAIGLSDTLSAEEWVRRRNEQLRKR